MPEAKSSPVIIIRDLVTIDDIRKVQPVEKQVWGQEDRDSVPMTMLIACKETGSILVGAFEGDVLAGFAFGFPALEQGRVSIHSHMLAVLPRYRDLDLGYKLKLAQRERALAMGIREITWTFDPLQSRNAHFNFAKLGVVAGRYIVDFYGRESSSVLHQNGTDRLWVRWPLSSLRVQQRLKQKPSLQEISSPVAPLVRFNGDGRPVRTDLAAALARQRICIEIPGDIEAIERAEPGLAWEWRMATRWAFTESSKAGFFVVEFSRNIRGQQGPGAYLLQAGSVQEFFPDN